jgi:hypothetical protein
LPPAAMTRSLVRLPPGVRYRRTIQCGRDRAR